MKIRLITAAVATVIAAWAPLSSARETVALPYIFGVAPGDSVGQATGIDATGAGLLTINPNININTLNDVGGGITSDFNNTASILFPGSSTITGFTGTSLIRFFSITAGANASTVNFNGNVFTTTFNLSGTGTVNFNGSLNPGIVAASTVFAADGFINVGANQLFNSAITTNTANTGTLTLNSGSSVIGAIGGANGLKRINVVGGNASINGAVQALGFNLGSNTLAISGGVLTTNPGGSISTTLVSNAIFGHITVGTSLINGGGITVIPTVTGALTNGTIFKIVDSPVGTLAAPVNVINNNPRYTFSGIPTTTGDVNIRLAAAPLATLVNAPGALAVAPVLDMNAPIGSDLRTIQDSIAILPSGAAINNALAQLAPGNTNLAAPWIAGQATRLFDDVLMARSEEIQSLCCDTSCDPHSSDAPVKKHECKTPEQRGNWWGKGFGSLGQQDDVNKSNGYYTDAYGMMLGYDTPINDETRVGLGGGYANSNIEDKHSEGRTKVDSYQLTGYFNYTPASWFLQGALTAGIDRYDSSRYIVFPGVNRKANSDYSGQQYTGLVTLGKHFYYDQTIITPLTSLQVSHINVDSYKEQGAGGAGLRVDNQDYDFVQSSLGVKVERIIQSGNATFSPEAHAKWLHDFNSTTMEQNAAFNGGGPTFQAQGIKQDRDIYNVGAGLTLLTCDCDKNAWTLKALYDYKWNENEYSSHQMSLIASLKF